MVLLTLAIMVAMIAFSLLLYILLIRLFASRSGFGKLSQLYAVQRPPDGPARARQTLMVGAVQWKRCVTIATSPGGLYLKIDPVMVRLPALLIPWSALRPLGKTLLYWQPAIRLSVGMPEVTTITVHRPLFDQMQPWLATSVADGQAN